MGEDSEKHRAPLGQAVPREMEKSTEPILEKGRMERRGAMGALYPVKSGK